VPGSVAAVVQILGVLALCPILGSRRVAAVNRRCATRYSQPVGDPARRADHRIHRLEREVQARVDAAAVFQMHVVAWQAVPVRQVAVCAAHLFALEVGESVVGSQPR
jgi:hypothetical protein